MIIIIIISSSSSSSSSGSSGSSGSSSIRPRGIAVRRPPARSEAAQGRAQLDSHPGGA